MFVIQLSITISVFILQRHVADSAGHPTKESFFAGNIRQLHKLWKESGANKDSFQAFMFFLPSYFDTIRDDGLKHGLMALTVFHAILDCQRHPKTKVAQLYKYFRLHMHSFIKAEIKEIQKSEPGATIENFLCGIPALRDIQMYLEFYGLCFQYFPLVRTEIPEAHNKYIKKEMMNGLVRQSAHHQALINEKSKYFINLLFSGMEFGPGNNLMSRKHVVEMIKRDCRILAGQLFDPSLLDLQYTLKRYGRRFFSMFVIIKTMSITTVFIGSKTFQHFKPFEHVPYLTCKDYTRIFQSNSSIWCPKKWKSKLQYIPTKKMFMAAVDAIVRPRWNTKFDHCCPSSNLIIKMLQLQASEWKYFPAKSICCEQKGFSSGIVKIGDCVQATTNQNEKFIMISHVCCNVFSRIFSCLSHRLAVFETRIEIWFLICFGENIIQQFQTVLGDLIPNLQTRGLLSNKIGKTVPGMLIQFQF